VRDAGCHELRTSLATLRALRVSRLRAGAAGAYNLSSGAGGRYQIIPSTWRAYGGTGSPQTASPAEQERVAARVYAGQGPSAWTNC
jgi:muramidase (phage lysozyme)